jgi:hypothetical protein
MSGLIYRQTFVLALGIAPEVTLFYERLVACGLL